MFDVIFSLWTLIEVIWIIIPAYAANGLTPLIGKFVKTHPIDAGKKLPDGQRVFGSGKTWEGLIFGCIIGGVIGLVEMLAYPYLPFGQSPVVLTIVFMGPVLGFLLGFGAMFGDLLGSFIKRRFKIPRGKPAPLLDQVDFLVVALLFASIIITVKIEWFILLLIITPVIHWVASLIGYVIRVKREPW